MAMGLEYEFEYGDDVNCPRECKSPIEAVARRTPMRDRSAKSSTAGAAEGTCSGAGWTLGLTGWTVGVLVLLLNVSSWGSSCWRSSLEGESEITGEAECIRERGLWRGRVGVAAKGRTGMDGRGC